MKIVACYKVFNEADFLRQSIDSIYDFVDQIVIVEGCLEGMAKIVCRDRITETGLSGDGTTEIIKSYPDRNRKIVYDPIGQVFADEVPMANRFLQHVDVGDYVWMVDGDEIYSEYAAEEMYRLIQLNWYNVIRPARYNFWRDFHHRIVGGGWYASHPRIFKIKEARMRFIHIAELVDAKERSTAVDPKRVLDTAFLPAFFFHPCYVRTTQKILEKKLWQTLEINACQNDETWQVLKKYNSLVEAIVKTDTFFTNEHESFINLIPVREALPKNLREHPFAAWKWDGSPLQIDLDYAKSLVTDVAL